METQPPGTHGTRKVYPTIFISFVFKARVKNAVEAPIVKLVDAFSNNMTNKFYVDVRDYKV